MGWVLVYFVTVAVPVPPSAAIPYVTYREEAKVMEFGFNTSSECLHLLERVQLSKPTASCWPVKEWAAQKRRNHYATIEPGEQPVSNPVVPAR